MSLPAPYYSQDGIVIFCADCRDILPLLEPGSVDLVLTDPPYSHRHMDGGGFAAASRFYRDGALEGLNDFDLEAYADLLIYAAPMLIAFHSRDLIGRYAALAARTGRSYDLHAWHKTNAIPFTANTWKSDLEYIALIWNKKPGWQQQEQHHHSKLYQSGINIDASHPAAKPLPLLSKYIQVLDAQSILDPFMGSGTTLRAAKDLGRRAIGIEIEEQYCALAVERLRQGVLL